MKTKYFIVALIAGSVLAVSANAGTLDDIKKRGYVHCGTAVTVPGFVYTDDAGKTKGFDVDLCHALAAAIFGDGEKIKLSKMTPRDAFPAVQTGQVDILTHRLTWSFNRDVGTGMNFTQVLMVDGQGFIVRKKLGVKSAKELSGASVCVSQGTTTELNVADYFRTNSMTYNAVTFATPEETVKAYENGRCDVYSTDRNGLAARSLGFKDRSEHLVLSETISKEPIGPVVAHGQDQWNDVARWVFNALIAAEEFGITSKNVDDIRKNSKNPEIQRMLGVSGNMGQQLQLSNDWAYNAVKQVGNYAEIWDRNIGPKTPLGLDRGRNAQWKDGGLLMALPFR